MSSDKFAVCTCDKMKRESICISGEQRDSSERTLAEGRGERKKRKVFQCLRVAKVRVEILNVSQVSAAV